MIVDDENEPLAGVFREDLELDLLHEFNETGSLGRIVNLEVSLTPQAVRNGSEKCESLASLLGRRNSKSLASMPPHSLLYEPTVQIICYIGRLLTNENLSRQSKSPRCCHPG